MACGRSCRQAPPHRVIVWFLGTRRRICGRYALLLRLALQHCARHVDTGGGPAPAGLPPVDAGQRSVPEAGRTLVQHGTLLVPLHASAAPSPHDADGRVRQRATRGQVRPGKQLVARPRVQGALGSQPHHCPWWCTSSTLIAHGIAQTALRRGAGGRPERMAILTSSVRSADPLLRGLFQRLAANVPLELCGGGGRARYDVRAVRSDRNVESFSSGRNAADAPSQGAMRVMAFHRSKETTFDSVVVKFNNVPGPKAAARAPSPMPLTRAHVMLTHCAAPKRIAAGVAAGPRGAVRPDRRRAAGGSRPAAAARGTVPADTQWHPSAPQVCRRALPLCEFVHAAAYPAALL